MKTIAIILFFYFFGFVGYSQQSDKWIKSIEFTDSPQNQLKKENRLDLLTVYNFSKIIIPQNNFIGFIGSDYKRILMKFDSARKNNDSTYIILGSSQVGNNKCIFNGELIIDKVKEFKNYHFGVDSIYTDSAIAFQGILIGHFLIKENIQQNSAGKFDGVFTIWFYINSSGLVIYDDINSYSDSYRNNQYVGQWTLYNSNKSKICNWGEYRIPFSGDLDIGSGGFSVNTKYLNNGWQNYK